MLNFSDTFVEIIDSFVENCILKHLEKSKGKKEYRFEVCKGFTFIRNIVI